MRAMKRPSQTAFSYWTNQRKPNRPPHCAAVASGIAAAKTTASPITGGVACLRVAQLDVDLR